MENPFVELIKLASCKFAIWLNKNRWYNYDEKAGKWCYSFEHGCAMSQAEYEKNYMKTSEELFDLFSEDEKQRILKEEKK